MARKPLINVNVPKVGRVRIGKVGLAATALSMGIVFGMWHWSSRIPYVGPYADTAKDFLRSLAGVPGTRILKYSSTAQYA